MKSTFNRLAAAAATLAHSATGILVTSGSSCDSQCGNVLDATTPADIVCDQDNYSSAAGVVFKNCMNCELTSNYYTTSPNESDQQWMLYNSRYALSECLFGEPGDVSVASSPCTTSRACGPFQDAFASGNFSTDPSVGAYDYCVDWQDSTFYDGCLNCLRADNAQYLANMLVLLQVACDQQPALGSTVSVQGSIFSTTLMNETSPTPLSDWTDYTNSGPISLGGKVGIAIGGLCVILAITGFCIVCNGRRRRRAFLRKLEMRHKDAGWPHPFAAGAGVVHRGPDMNETPLSQKPLRGWDDSPLSATASEPSYARYFSPYSSQQTSPVNGAQMSMAHQWPQQFHDEPTHGGYPSSSAQEQTMQDHSIPSGFPTSAQEKAMLDQHETATTGTATPPTHIGLALGGDEPSLRSKPSAVSAQSREGEGGGDDAGEAYELHEVSSSAGGSSAGGTNMVGSSNSFRNRVARENRAPMLQHPGYGRYSPERVLPPPPPIHSMSGGLVDDEEKRI
ncbi:hypothetical protein N0V93_006194 [Gnomoniopsis smithogilvyi]|uniref:Uncharacterized protein n=1 Tax=Gnomoniopsis smithogilvyi TaxID=1191159 RepID=A0A9W8YPD6_9PEZI|nr:hypothetical protein N0V93_006194 [Gnomoniopsis smithogilvyi]